MGQECTKVGPECQKPLQQFSVEQENTTAFFERRPWVSWLCSVSRWLVALAMLPAICRKQ